MSGLATIDNRNTVCENALHMQPREGLIGFAHLLDARDRGTLLADPIIKKTSEKRDFPDFSPDAIRFLRRKGYVIYSLRGESLRDQMEEKKPLFNWVVNVDKGFLNLPSITGQVAFDPSPDGFFLPDSNNSTLKEQQEMIADYSDKLQREFGSDTIEAFMGEVPDVSAIVFSHLKATGGKEYLFGERCGYGYARTRTPTNSERVSYVGGAGGALVVSGWTADIGNPNIYALALIRMVKSA